jgi:replicative DNA helicase
VVQSIEEVRRRSAGRVPPHNLEAEESLLGAMLLSRDAITAAVEARVDASDFYKPAHGHVFEAVMALYGQGEPVDPVTVAEELRRAELLEALGGKATLLRIQAGTPASANAGHYASIVSELALLRRLIAVAGDIAEMGYEAPDDVTETLDRAESLVFEVAERRVAESLTGISESLQSTLDQIESLYGRDSDITGVPTGYLELDDLLLGLQPSTLITVAARPGAGKTSFALGAAANVALVSRRPTLFFSMEMGNLELTKRLLAAEARVEAKKLWTGNIPEADWTRLSHAVGRLAEAPLFIDDNPHCTVMEMRAKARRIKARHGDLGMVVVDYLQLMSSGVRRPESRQVEVSDLSRGLKILARELECPVMALSQLNRQLEYRQDKRPMLADLRESGCMTADTRVTRADTGADVTMGELVERDERDIPVWTLDEHYKLVRGVMTHVFPSGVKPVYEMHLASGHTVTASANHPFLTIDGWARLDELAEGSRIAVARELRSGERSHEGRHAEPPRFGALDPTWDLIPSGIWDYIRHKAMPVMELSAQQLVDRLGIRSHGPSLYEHGLARGVMARLARVLSDPLLRDLAESDVLWDRVVSITPRGEQAVFDATVTGTHNFLANGIVAHNSIEQDSDVVCFIYRDEIYNPESDQRGTAEIIVAKHRNGPTGHTRLAFLDHFTKFANMARD